MTDTEQPPEGALIAAAVERSGKSTRALAALAGISDTRWRHIVNGYQPVGSGQRVKVVGPASTIARMARAVDLRPSDLAEVGRDDAAAILTDLEREDEASWVLTDRIHGLTSKDLLGYAQDVPMPADVQAAEAAVDRALRRTDDASQQVSKAENALSVARQEFFEAVARLGASQSHLDTLRARSWVTQAEARIDHALAADEQQEEPEGLRVRREQDEAAERGDG